MRPGTPETRPVSDPAERHVSDQNPAEGATPPVRPESRRSRRQRPRPLGPPGRARRRTLRSRTPVPPTMRAGRPAPAGAARRRSAIIGWRVALDRSAVGGHRGGGSSPSSGRPAGPGRTRSSSVTVSTRASSATKLAQVPDRQTVDCNDPRATHKVIGIVDDQPGSALDNDGRLRRVAADRRGRIWLGEHGQVRQDLLPGRRLATSPGAELAALDAQIMRVPGLPAAGARGGRRSRATRRAAFRDEEYWGRAGARLRSGRRPDRDPRPGPGRARRQPDRPGLHRRPLRRRALRRRCTGPAWPTSRPASPDRRAGRCIDTRIFAAVRCAPPDNKPTPAERDTCAPWLHRELALLRPTLRVVVALGAFAWAAFWPALRRRSTGCRRRARGRRSVTACGWTCPARRSLLGCYHVSQQNTFTGRLTPAMLDDVLAARDAPDAGRAGQCDRRLSGSGWRCLRLARWLPLVVGGRAARRGHARRRLRQPAASTPCRATAAARRPTRRRPSDRVAEPPRADRPRRRRPAPDAVAGPLATVAPAGRSAVGWSSCS